MEGGALQFDAAGGSAVQRNYPPRRTSVAAGRVFQARDALFQGLEHLPCALEHLRLDVEFLACDEIESGEETGHEGARVLLDIRGRAGGDEGAQAVAEFLEYFGVEHGVGLSENGSFERVEFSTAHQNDARHRLGAVPIFCAPAMCADRSLILVM